MIFLLLTLTACSDKTPEDTSTATVDTEPTETGATDTETETETDPDAPFAITVEVEDNPTLVLEKTFVVTANHTSTVEMTCVLGSDEEEVHVLSSPSAAAHTLSLRGILAASTYSCELVADDGEEVLTESIDLTIAATPDLPEMTRAVTDGERRGYTLLNHSLGPNKPSQSRLLIVDEEGRVRWYYDAPGDPKDLDAQYIGDDALLYGGGYYTRPTLLDLSHEILLEGPEASSGEAHHHHTEWLPDETILSMASNRNDDGGPDWAGFVVEIRDAWSGKLEWMWDSQKGVDDGRLLIPGPGEGGDVYHLNWAGVDDDSAYFNLRDTHQILNVDRETGDINWILGVGEDFALLDESGSPAPDDQWFYGAHGHDIDGDRILMYDNGWTRPGGEYSRILELTLDKTARTATISWDYEGDGWFEPIWGDADYLNDDRILITRGHCDACTDSGPGSAIIEVDRATEEVVWQIEFDTIGDATYRSQRIDACTIFSNQKYCP